MSQRKQNNNASAAAAPLAADNSSVAAPMRFTKRFNVQITGTMANFDAEGPSTAQWRPIEGQHVKMFTNASADSDLGSTIKVLEPCFSRRGW